MSSRNFSTFHDNGANFHSHTFFIQQHSTPLRLNAQSVAIVAVLKEFCTPFVLPRCPDSIRCPLGMKYIGNSTSKLQIQVTT